MSRKFSAGLGAVHTRTKLRKKQFARKESSALTKLTHMKQPNTYATLLPDRLHIYK